MKEEAGNVCVNPGITVGGRVTTLENGLCTSGVKNTPLFVGGALLTA